MTADCSAAGWCGHSLPCGILFTRIPSAHKGPYSEGRTASLSKTQKSRKNPASLDFILYVRTIFPKRGGGRNVNLKRHRGAIKVLRRQAAAAHGLGCSLTPCLSEGEGGAAAVCHRKRVQAKERAPDGARPGKRLPGSFSGGALCRPRGG